MRSDFLNFHDMTLVLTFVECLFLGVLLRVLPSKRAQSRYLLSVFFFLVAGWVAATLFIWNPALQTSFINQTLITPLLLSSCILLQGPCLYFYLRSLTEHINMRRLYNLIHLMPALLAALVITVFGIDGTDWVPTSNLPNHEKLAAEFCWVMVRISPLVYVFACFYAVYQLPRKYQHLYSSLSTFEIKLSYLVLIGFFLHWLWACIGYLVGPFLTPEVNSLMGDTEDFLIVLQVNGLFILGLRNARDLLNLTQPEIAKPTEQVLDPKKIEILEKAVKERKLHMENNINLERFSELAGLKTKDVSLVVNLHYKLNFFEFINGLRLEEAKRMLTSPEFEDVSILDIIYKSGFNSQSAFQRFFKKVVGCTPTEYRRINAQTNKSDVADSLH